MRARFVRVMFLVGGNSLSFAGLSSFAAAGPGVLKTPKARLGRFLVPLVGDHLLLFIFCLAASLLVPGLFYLQPPGVGGLTGGR